MYWNSICRQWFLERIDDTLGDLVLDREDVLHFAIEAVGPEPVAILYIDQLRRDADEVARLADAAFENGLDPEFGADLPDVCSRALVLK